MPDGSTLFERACRGERGERAPAWIMRQAGRYLPEYRALRSSVDFVTATKTPDIATEITLQPLRRFGLDAAILFSDIMTPLEGMGVPLHFAPGPVLDDPVRSVADIERMRMLDPEEHADFVLEALRLTRRELAADQALLAFAGAPFTLFCYLVEGGGSKDFMTARAFLRSEPAAARRLLELLGRSMERYLVAQARAGADALMLFDSWAGLLGPDEYARFALPTVASTVAAVREATGKPVIYYARGGAAPLASLSETGADVTAVDWTVRLSDATRTLGPEAVVQGNLDPAALFASDEELAHAIDSVLDEGAGAAAHIFNLGQGIHRETDPGRVGYLVERVAESSARSAVVR